MPHQRPHHQALPPPAPVCAGRERPDHHTRRHLTPRGEETRSPHPKTPGAPRRQRLEGITEPVTAPPTALLTPRPRPPPGGAPPMPRTGLHHPAMVSSASTPRSHQQPSQTRDRPQKPAPDRLHPLSRSARDSPDTSRQARTGCGIPQDRPAHQPKRCRHPEPRLDPLGPARTLRHTRPAAAGPGHGPCRGSGR